MCRPKCVFRMRRQMCMRKTHLAAHFGLPLSRVVLRAFSSRGNFAPGVFSAVPRRFLPSRRSSRCGYPAARVAEFYQVVANDEAQRELEVQIRSRRLAWLPGVMQLRQCCSDDDLALACELAIGLARGLLPSSGTLHRRTGVSLRTVERRRAGMMEVVRRIFPAREVAAAAGRPKKGG
jgi:hypothetical protein